MLRRLSLSTDQFTFTNRNNESVDSGIRERSGDHRLESDLVIHSVVGNKEATGHYPRHNLFVAQGVDFLLRIEKAEADLGFKESSQHPDLIGVLWQDTDNRDSLDSESGNSGGR
jgi:hypothetical protein